MEPETRPAVTRTLPGARRPATAFRPVPASLIGPTGRLGAVEEPARPSTRALTPADHRGRGAATAIIAGLVVGYGLLVPQGGHHAIDHGGALDTLNRMRHGQGFYAAFRDAYLTIGVRLGGPRSFRTPYLFLLLRGVPPSLLYPAFLALVVGGTSAFLLRTTRRPLLVVPVAAYLLLAGRTPGGATGVEGWLLVELWTVPLLAASTWAWKRERWWASALTLAAAVLIRELALPVLLVALVLAARRRTPLTPWLVGLGVAVAGWALHIALAFQVGAKHGTESPLWGTGQPPWTILHMLVYPAWRAPFAVVGLVVWALALGWAWQHRGSVPPVGVLLSVPVLGLLVNRAYWGLPIIPFVVLWAGEQATDLAVRARAGTAAPAPATTAPITTAPIITAPIITAPITTVSTAR